MKPILLILILVGDHRSEQLGDRVAEELRRVGQDQVQVLVAAEAIRVLERRQVHAEDVLTGPVAGKALTAQDADVAIIDLHFGVGAMVDAIDSRIWVAGKENRHIMAAADGGDPMAATVTAIESGLAHRVAAFGAVIPPVDEAALAALVERGEWQQLVQRLADVAEPSVRQSYDLVLAYARLGQVAEARSAFAAMKAAYGEDGLVAQAEEMLPAAPAGEEHPEAGGTRFRTITGEQSPPEPK